MRRKQQQGIICVRIVDTDWRGWESDWLEIEPVILSLPLNIEVSSMMKCVFFFERKFSYACVNKAMFIRI